jgi:hypothetical protein
MVSIRTKIAFACFVLVGGLLSGTASAQVSIDQGDDEVTTADAAAKLLQPVDEEGNAQLVEDLAANGVEGADESGAAEVSEGPDPFAAEGGPLTLMNCSGGSIRVKTYNSNDAVLWVPYKEFSIADGASTQLSARPAAAR